MVDDIVPARFWRFPMSRWLSWDDEDELMPFGSNNGLSIHEDEKHIYVEAALPGVDPKDVEITFDKGMLWIKGESKEEEKKKNKYYRKSASSFSYRVAVPGEIDPSIEPEATGKNGVMTVTFTKHPQTQPKKIAVKAGK